MDAGHGVRLLSLRCDLFANTSNTIIDDVLDYFDPHVVYIIRHQRDMRIASKIRNAFDGPTFIAGAGADTIRTVEIDAVRLTVANETDSLRTTPTEKKVPADTPFILCDDIDIETDSIRLTTTLDGLTTLATYQTQTDGETTFLTGALGAGYDYVWHPPHDGSSLPIPVHGMAPLPRSGTPEIPCLTLNSAGHVAVTSAPADRFGLQALDEVGPTTATRLANQGYKSRAAIADASLSKLTTIQGIGTETAQSITQSARALAHGEVVRTTNAAVPPPDSHPVFVDIETDGLHPTIIWLIGVYDPETETYVDFVDTDPTTDAPGQATREFISWLAGEYEHVSLITWNGHDFDFKHLDRFIARYAPEFMKYWNDAVFKYDLYDWATRKGNAVLPGRTNRLEDVAMALGCDRDAMAAAVDGKSLATSIQQRLRSPERAAEIDWDAAQAYCEADVRELAAVHTAMDTAASKQEPSPADNTTTTQTGLTDF